MRQLRIRVKLTCLVYARLKAAETVESLVDYRLAM